MTRVLFVVVENHRQYCGSPPYKGSVLHLVCESREHNNGMHRTRNKQAFHLQSIVRAADARRLCLFLCGILGRSEMATLTKRIKVSNDRSSFATLWLETWGEDYG